MGRRDGTSKSPADLYAGELLAPPTTPPRPPLLRGNCPAGGVVIFTYGAPYLRQLFTPYLDHRPIYQAALFSRALRGQLRSHFEDERRSFRPLHPATLRRLSPYLSLVPPASQPASQLGGRGRPQAEKNCLTASLPFIHTDDMPLCRRCGTFYRGDPDELCEPCEEFTRQVHREELGVICLHCGQTFMPEGFKQHQWRVYYRGGEHPRGARPRR